MAADADSVLESPSFVPQLFPVEVVMLYAIIPPSNPSGVKVVLLDVNGGPVAAMEPIEDLVVMVIIIITYTLHATSSQNSCLLSGGRRKKHGKGLFGFFCPWFQTRGSKLRVP